MAEDLVMGIYRDDAAAAEGIRTLKRTPFTFRSAHSPIPSSRIAEAVGAGKSRVGLFTLAGGITGFFTGYLLAAYTAVQWHLIVGGKPIVALIPFFIVGFEFTILFAVFGNIIGLLILARLPDRQGLIHYDPRCSGEEYGVLAACPPGKAGDLAAFFRETGADVRTFADPAPEGDTDA